MSALKTSLNDDELAPELQALVEPLTLALEAQAERMEEDEDFDEDEDEDEDDFDEDEEEEEEEGDENEEEGDEDEDFDEDEDLDEDELEAERHQREEVVIEQALAQQVLQGLEGRTEQLGELERRCDGSVVAWLLELPFELADFDLLEDAIGLCRRAAAVLGSAEFLCTVARLLSNAGRRDEALAEIEPLLVAHRDDAEVMDTAADVLLAAGEAARAEELSRRMLKHPLIQEEPELKFAALDRLVDILRDSGRTGEAAEMEAAIDEIEWPEEDEWPRQPWDEAEAGEEVWSADAGEAGLTGTSGAPQHGAIEPIPVLPVLPFRREAPKVGRNAPCPCGSGKKFKKCCGTN